MTGHQPHVSPEKSPSRPARRLSFLTRICMAGVLFFSLSFAAHAWPQKHADFANHNLSLYQQVAGRIQNKILARLGEGKNNRDRYFIIPFAYQNKGNDPGYSHSFMTVIRVLPDNKQVKLVRGITTRTYKDREFQAFTVSWLPHDFTADPNLCVFKGFGARLFPTWNQCPPVEGKSFKLEETLQLAANVKNAVCMWGPYEITKEGFDLGVKRLRLLESGKIKYRADDRLTRKDQSAINCFHAMAGLTDFYPNGGLFGTGFKMWGINGTARVLLEYNDTARLRKILLEPVDEKNDRYGFVYATDEKGRYYNPFKTASAYQR
ncbi:hypothetical protein JIN84_20350 [Luteolibacter yonseiensis]|uniref:Uncharacterized protein n=1 Tax=Luteolibacter yonseiensis TaxID=1144680 RepID=A0A934VDB9_9BACT|nr:hypothetical protein [Luteolibacter yonseiensis]MBK1817985.1 hypothetical protein [Luteolibacter yonseiensis]